MGELPRLPQTFGRIGAGLACMATLLWLLWDGVRWPLEAEPLVAFLVAMFVWISTEFKRSDEIVFRSSSPNDVRVAKTLLGYSAFQLRELLKDHDFSNGLPSRYLTEFSAYSTDCDRRLIKLQKLSLRRPFEDFSYQLDKLVKMIALSTSPGRQNVEFLYVQDPYWGLQELEDHHRVAIENLNRQATLCWDVFSILLRKIHADIPEAFDEEITLTWNYWDPNR